ncbi:hypothetical protein IGB42_01886 [Andreprevotia sp. IGB-42]|nr:hypothetical protein IGB42_01886 [Andreprevotia sp. IGB-42]
MKDLEHALWHAIMHGPCQYGRLQITQSHILQLQQLSDACGGWIGFDDHAEEVFIPMARWRLQAHA